MTRLNSRDQGFESVQQVNALAQVMQIDGILESMPPLKNDKVELEKQKKAVR